MENFEVKQISDENFVFEIFYKKTKTNEYIAQLIEKFVKNPYANLRTKYILDLKEIGKKNILLIINPDCKNPRDTFCPAYYYKPYINRPYILISVHLEPFEDEPMADFSILFHAIPHEILHELYDDCATINGKLSEFENHCNKQMLKDFNGLRHSR